MVKKPTIDDIARLAGVSKATVSRVLNHKPDVDAATRERILRIVEEQGFVRSVTATGLAGGRSHLIGMLIPSFTWSFIPDIVRGASEVIGKTSYELVLYSMNDSAQKQDRAEVIQRILATKLTAGLLAVFPGQAVSLLSRLHQPDFPVVLLDDQEIPTSIPWAEASAPRVSTNNLIGAYEAVRYLLGLGHRRIAHIQGPQRYIGARERYHGYRRALEEQGPVDPALVVEGDYTSKGGHLAAEKFFALPPEQRPTAIFAANDLMSYGVLAAAEEAGIQIPRDLSLVGFDDLTTSMHVYPQLTTIRQPFFEMGGAGIELLLSFLERPRSLELNNTRWSPVLMPGSSILAGSQIDMENGNPSVHLPTSLVTRASAAAPAEQGSASTNQKQLPADTVKLW